MNLMDTYYKSFIFTTSLVFAYSYWYLNNNENAIILKDYNLSINPTSEQINVHIVSDALQGTSKTLLIIHSMHLYFYVLNLIFDDIDDIESIIKYHILGIILYMSNINLMSFFEMNTWLILFGSLYSSKYILRIGKEIYLLIY